MTAIFGEFITDWQLEQAVISHLRAWMPDYIPEAQRKANAALAAFDRGPLSENLPQPRSYSVTPREPDRWKEEQLPAILIVSSGLKDPPRQDGGDVYRGTFLLGIASICSAGTEEMSKLFAGLYFAAAAQILLDKPSLGGFAQGITFEGAPQFDWLTGDRDRTLASRYCVFGVDVGRIFEITGGPSEHLADPTEDPGDFPTVDTHDLELEIP